MAALQNKLSTPALVPWIPPGKPKESSSNVMVHKKNSGPYDLGSSIASSSTVFNQPRKKKVSLETKFWSPQKNSRKLTLGPDRERRIEHLLTSSVNSKAEQDLLRNKLLGTKIKDIFDEEELKERSMDPISEKDEHERKNKRRNSDPGPEVDPTLTRKNNGVKSSRGKKSDGNAGDRGSPKLQEESSNNQQKKHHKTHHASDRDEHDYHNAHSSRVRLTF